MDAVVDFHLHCITSTFANPVGTVQVRCSTSSLTLTCFRIPQAPLWNSQPNSKRHLAVVSSVFAVDIDAKSPIINREEILDVVHNEGGDCQPWSVCQGD